MTVVDHHLKPLVHLTASSLKAFLSITKFSAEYLTSHKFNFTTKRYSLKAAVKRNNKLKYLNEIFFASICSAITPSD